MKKDMDATAILLWCKSETSGDWLVSIPRCVSTAVANAQELKIDTFLQSKFRHSLSLEAKDSSKYSLKTRFDRKKRDSQERQDQNEGEPDTAKSPKPTAVAHSANQHQQSQVT